VESGVFEIEINAQKQILRKGDSFHVPSNVLHGALCIENGVLIDAFSPMRADFIS
jgi:quercetin dioxygenase-like cupin family protein